MATEHIQTPLEGWEEAYRATPERDATVASALPAPPEGKRLRYPTERPFEEAARLASLGLKLTAFRVDQPDLEKVFLNLTGRSLRD